MSVVLALEHSKKVLYVGCPECNKILNSVVDRIKVGSHY